MVARPGRRSPDRQNLLVAVSGSISILAAVWAVAAGAVATPSCDPSLKTIEWDGGAGTSSWHAAANWNDVATGIDRLPTAIDHVCIDAFGATVQYTTGTTSVLSVQVATGASLELLFGEAILEITDTAVDSEISSLTLAAGATLTGAGDVALTSSFTFSSGIHSGKGITTLMPGASLDMDAPEFGGVTVSGGRDLIVGAGATAYWGGNVSPNLIFPSTIANSGDFTFSANDNLSFTGTGSFLNTGTVTKTSAGTSVLSAPFDNDGTVVVQAGTLDLTGTFANYEPATDVITGGTYEIQGTLSFTGADVNTNESTIVLDGASSRLLDTQGEDGLRNFAVNGSNGSFTVTNGRDFTRSGSFSSGGDLTVGPGSTFTATTLDVTGGRLGGTGTLAAQLTNSGGTVAPGSSAGTLTIDGDFTQGSGGTTEVDVAGTDPGGFDVLSVTGTASLDGSLVIVTDPGFTPIVGDTFQFHTAGSRTGTFDSVEGVDAGNGNFFRLQYGAQDVAMSVIGPPSISTSDAAVVEGDAGSTDASFSVTLSGPSDLTVTVDFDTADDTATAPQDYEALSGTLTFLPGEVSKSITVEVNGDTFDEPDETFFVNLSSPSNATLADDQGQGTITDDDPARTVPSDFNGDGFADLAIGAPFEDVGDLADAGAVHVLYGSAGGLQATSPMDQLWTQDSPDVEDDAEADDQFGWSLAVGDFNGDGFGDLAIGAPSEDVGAVSGAGAVHVLYGGALGLQVSTHADQLWTRDGVEGDGQARMGDRFGRALGVGDFNADGISDLAVGTPYQDVGQPALLNSGAVHVLYGVAEEGLQSILPEAQVWNQDSPEVEDETGNTDLFGWALAGGDFNRDGYDDLAVGVPLDNPGGINNAGVVNVLHGSAEGLQTASPQDQAWSQDSPEVEEQAEENDEFGAVLAAGDFNGDGFDDLAVSVTAEDLGDLLRSTALVHAFYGSSQGLQTESPEDQAWTQDSPDVEDEVEHQDRFGWSVAVGDFNGDGFSDLAIGVRLENVEGVSNAGAVNVLYGSAAGLQAVFPDDQFWTQDSPEVEDAIEEGDRLGRSVGAGDYNGDGYEDLSIGVPAEDLRFRDVGGMNALYGSAVGLQATSPEDQFWSQQSADVEDRPERNDKFAESLPAGG